jgi:EAL domain-containing protein (putative c-di-GMP-specific phosphodiesterase class I)
MLLEITESAYSDNAVRLIEVINNLRGKGFRIEMDDFGSGYSSLNSLKDMPLDVLKLDAGFFSGDFDDNRGEIVVSDTIKLAKNLNMVTVAEGVEFKEQVDFLAEQGCDMIQGYFYARPMPADEYILKMERSKAENEIINPES